MSTHDLTPAPPTGTPRWVVAVAAGIIGLGAGYGLALVTLDGTAATADDPPASSSNQPTSTPTEDSGYDFGGQPVMPEPEDFDIDLKVTSKECFGTAGCNVEFKINPESSYTGTADLTEFDDTITVTYEIVGAEDAYIDSMTLDRGTVRYNPTGFVRTASEDTELSVKVTDVY